MPKQEVKQAIAAYKAAKKDKAKYRETQLNTARQILSSQVPKWDNISVKIMG